MSDGTVTIRVGKRHDSLTPVKLHPARLWGEEVLMDSDGWVYCRGCNEMVDVFELARPGNGHFAAAPGTSGDGMVVSFAEHQS